MKTVSRLALSIVLALSMCVGVAGLVGCGSSSPASASSASASASDTSASGSSAGSSDAQDDCYGDDLPAIKSGSSS